MGMKTFATTLGVLGLAAVGLTVRLPAAQTQPSYWFRHTHNDPLIRGNVTVTVCSGDGAWGKTLTPNGFILSFPNAKARVPAYSTIPARQHCEDSLAFATGLIEPGEPLHEGVLFEGGDDKIEVFYGVNPPGFGPRRIANYSIAIPN
jgi:hypothetical protein